MCVIVDFVSEYGLKNNLKYRKKIINIELTMRKTKQTHILINGWHWHHALSIDS